MQQIIDFQKTFNSLNKEIEEFKQNVLNVCLSVEPEEAFEMLTKFKIFDSYNYNTAGIFNVMSAIWEHKRLNKTSSSCKEEWVECDFNFNSVYKDFDKIDFETYVNSIDKEEVWDEESLNYIDIKPKEISLYKVRNSGKTVFEYKIPRKEFYKTIVDIMLKYKVCGYTLGFFPV